MYGYRQLVKDKVALRKESVDRNRLKHPGGRLEQVALRKESVDRNYVFDGIIRAVVVALRKESMECFSF